MTFIRRGLGLLGVFLLFSCAELSEQNTTDTKRALIIVDMQYDFVEGGALATAGGAQIVTNINSLQPHFDLVVATQDWHPKGHGSFASSHPGKKPGETIDLNGIKQVLWPDHAVQDSHGAKLLDDLDQSRIARIFQKGTDPRVDSYSGFFDNQRKVDTGLASFLKTHDVSEVFVVGLALDYCVKFTALDSRHSGFDTTLIVDVSRAVNLNSTDGADAVKEMRSAGINIVRSNDFFNTKK